MPFVHPTWGPLHLGNPHRSAWNRKAMAKALRMHDFLSTLPPAPDILDCTNNMIDWGQMLNDREGDCTCAACGHMLQSYTGAAGKDKIVTVPDAAIEAEYEALSGYDPKTGANDNGAMISDALDYFRDKGLNGYRISAHAEVNITQMRVQQGMYVFGPLNFGIELPINAQNEVGDLWDIEGNPFDCNNSAFPGSWGGHSMAAVYYSPKGVDFVTWGSIQRATWRWVMFYARECHAAIYPGYAKCPEPINELANDLIESGT